MPELITSPTANVVIAAGAILPPLCTLAVVLRIKSSRQTSRRLLADDWLTLPALVLLWAQGICLIIGAAKHALGYLPSDGVNPFTISTPETILSRQLLFATLLIQIPGLTFVKLSLVFFYRRVFISAATAGSGLDKFLKALAGILIAWAVAFFFSELFICGTQFEDVWISKTTVERSKDCVQLEPFDLGLTISDFLLDLLLFLVPIRPLFLLPLRVGQKIGLGAVFSLGALAIAASITRFVVFTDSEDMTVTIAVYWTCVETGLALLASCLPLIFGLFNNTRRRRKASKQWSWGHGLLSNRSGRAQNADSGDGTEMRPSRNSIWPRQSEFGEATRIDVRMQPKGTGYHVECV